jgi:peroxiredoxin
VVVLGVNTGEQGQQAEKARKFRDAHSLSYPIWLDVGDKVASRYGVTGFPTNLLIDRKGRVYLAETGFDPGGLEHAIGTLLKSR